MALKNREIKKLKKIFKLAAKLLAEAETSGPSSLDATSSSPRTISTHTDVSTPHLTRPSA